ncbi:tyrosine-type recombinase/integrase [Saccharopolyspora sp. 5N708]|uniref:tyrosine-type recombinase/integrase n=1 Tax=Saccharopolyspora sp. 5N708 TaxID=3457424 RepID=UPI003FD10CF9
MGVAVLTSGDETRDSRVTELAEALDPDFLALLRWDWNLKVAFFPADHVVLGSPLCKVVQCGKRATHSSGLCTVCRRYWREHGADGDFDSFLQQTPRWQRNIGISACLVADCPRPWTSKKSGLCMTHRNQRATMKLSLDAFLADPRVCPLRGYGFCAVAACYRARTGPIVLYCHAHGMRWRTRTRGTTDAPDETVWRQTEPAIAVSGEVSLRGLSEYAVAEVLYALQERTAQGVKTSAELLRPLVDHLRARGLRSVDEVDPDAVGSHTYTLAQVFRTCLRRRAATPETERRKDTWDLTVFGRPGQLHFEKIQQPAFKEALKIWAYDDLPRRRGKGSRTTTQGQINAMVLLLESLRLQRADRGNVLSALGRNDILAFCNRLAFLVADGKISSYRHVRICRSVRKVLQRCRTLGLTKSGQPLEGLPPDFALDKEDLPDEPEDTEAGRDLPDDVMTTLCDNLDLLESMSSREIRVAVELMIDTGRRPDEICRLPFDCLTQDPDGSHVLLYDNHKNYRLGRRLPIGQATAGVITRQQERIRARFPDTPTSELKLLPAPAGNPGGRKSIASVQQHRAWIDALPDFLVPATLEIDGATVTKQLPFDKAKIFPYAYRHTYAQRHADAGVDPDVLRQLMDHRQLTTTQAYYRVRDERRRDAVDRVTAMQFDRHGNRIWRKVQDLLDSEHIRRGVGEISVPYGLCTEPSNVAAGGTSCPVRFRCVGCGFFRTDVSYLPDLEAYLADLRRSRERLLSTFDADEWAKTEATPSDQEISRVKRLIDRVKADLDDLTTEEQAQIQHAVAIVRKGRNTLLGMPTIRQPQPDTDSRRSE